MIHYGNYSPEVVESACAIPGARKILPDGQDFRKSERITLFFTKGRACVRCGIEGTVFVLESHSEDVRPHLNLYAVNAKGKFVLMTKDHIIPKSKGGANSLENYDPMCQPCNGKKADKVS